MKTEGAVGDARTDCAPSSSSFYNNGTRRQLDQWADLIEDYCARRRCWLLPLAPSSTSLLLSGAPSLDASPPRGSAAEAELLLWRSRPLPGRPENSRALLGPARVAALARVASRGAGRWALAGGSAAVASSQPASVVLHALTRGDRDAGAPPPSAVALVVFAAAGVLDRRGCDGLTSLSLAVLAWARGPSGPPGGVALLEDLAEEGPTGPGGPPPASADACALLRGAPLGLVTAVVDSLVACGAASHVAGGAVKFAAAA